MDGIEKIKIKECQIPKSELQDFFHMYLESDTGQLKWQDLTGPEKLKLFKKLKISEIFPFFHNQITFRKFGMVYFK